MINKTLSIPAALLIAIIGAAPPASAGGADAELAGICTTGQRVLYRIAGHPGKSIQLPQRQATWSKGCSTRTAKALVLASFLDAPGGTSLIAGRAERALDDIRRRTETSTHEQINLCVALTVLRQWDEARPACDESVKAAQAEHNVTRGRPNLLLRSVNERLAAAYSNRAVMHWLASDPGAAHADLSKARAVAPGAAFVKRNLELTVRVPAQLQLPVKVAAGG